MNKMISNLLNMFDGENGVQMEQEYDKIVSQLSKSNLLDIIFRSTVPGSTLDALLQNITGNPDAIMPKKFSIASTAEQPGELEILLSVIKAFIKNGGSTIFELVTDGEVSQEDIREILDFLKKDVNESPDVDEKLIDILLKSGALRCFLSGIVSNMEFSGIRLYVTESASEVVEEVVTLVDDEGRERVEVRKFNIIKQEELSILFDFIFDSTDLFFDLIGGKDLDLLEVVTSDEVVNLIDESNLVKGIVASVVISLSSSVDMILLPYGYDAPEQWIIDGEVEALVDTIINLKEEKTESGDSLLTSLLGGSIDINTALDLSKETIEKLYGSKVLRYTISNVLTNIGGDGGFSIVIPAVVCNEKNAPTTIPGKTVNVVSPDELVDIFQQIKNIVKIDGSNIEVQYAKIFNNKSEILESYTIQATIMGMLINMSGEEDSVISVPKRLKDDFDRFVTTETVEELADNRWFVPTQATLLSEGSPVEDDELYLLFEAIEELLGDEYKTTDEEGNEIVSDNFSIDNISDSIKIKNFCSAKDTVKRLKRQTIQW